VSAWAICSASSTEPSSDRNTSRLGMGWVNDLLSQEWILSRQPAATFWHSKLPRCFRRSLLILFYPSKVLFWGQSGSPLSGVMQHPVGPKSPPTPAHNTPFHQKILPSMLLSRSRRHALRIVLEKLPSVCLVCSMNRKTSHLTPAHCRGVTALSTVILVFRVLNFWS